MIEERTEKERMRNAEKEDMLPDIHELSPPQYYIPKANMVSWFCAYLWCPISLFTPLGSTQCLTKCSAHSTNSINICGLNSSVIKAGNWELVTHISFLLSKDLIAQRRAEPLKHWEFSPGLKWLIIILYSLAWPGTITTFKCSV